MELFAEGRYMYAVAALVRDTLPLNHPACSCLKIHEVYKYRPAQRLRLDFSRHDEEGYASMEPRVYTPALGSDECFRYHPGPLCARSGEQLVNKIDIFAIVTIAAPQG